MKFSATILALVSSSVLINGKLMSKQTLVQTSASVERSAPSVLDAAILWAPTATALTTDAFGNTYQVDADTWVFTDKASGTTTTVFSDHVEESHVDGSSLYYDFNGLTKYTDVVGNVWTSNDDGSEDYVAVNGDEVITSADGEDQIYYQVQADESIDKYHYGDDGSQQWYQGYDVATGVTSGDKWYWDQPDYEWCYYFADTETWACVGQDGIGCLTTPLGNRVCYNKYNDEWLYADSTSPASSAGYDNFQFFYYPEWAWGTSDQEWYLWDDLHDAWVTAAA